MDERPLVNPFHSSAAAMTAVATGMWMEYALLWILPACTVLQQFLRLDEETGGERRRKRRTSLSLW